MVVIYVYVHMSIYICMCVCVLLVSRHVVPPFLMQPTWQWPKYEERCQTGFLKYWTALNFLHTRPLAIQLNNFRFMIHWNFHSNAQIWFIGLTLCSRSVCVCVFVPRTWRPTRCVWRNTVRTSWSWRGVWAAVGPPATTELRPLSTSKPACRS